MQGSARSNDGLLAMGMRFARLQDVFASSQLFVRWFVPCELVLHTKKSAHRIVRFLWDGLMYSRLIGQPEVFLRAGAANTTLT